MSNHLHSLVILVILCIACNEVAAQLLDVRGGRRDDVNGVKGIKRFRPGYDSNKFLVNFFRTKCRKNEEHTFCQTMEGLTCWEPEAGTSEYPCREGCDCVTGYLRNSLGLCVLEQRCDTRIKPPHYVEPLRTFMERRQRLHKKPEGVRPY